MHYKVYRTSQQPDGNVGFMKICETDSRDIADYSICKTAEGLGSALVVILVEGGSITRIAIGGNRGQKETA